jgi:hypothetical protein
MLEVKFTCEHPAQMAAEVEALHRVLSGSSALNTLAVSDAPHVANRAPQNATASAAAETKPVGRGRKKNPVPEQAKDPERPEGLNRAENDFIVYEKDGAMGPGYAHAKDAVSVIVSRLAKIDDVEELDVFAAANEATLQRMDEKDADPAYQAIQARYAALGAPKDFSDDGNDPQEIKFEDVKANLRAFGEKIGGSNGAMAVKKLMEEFKLDSLSKLQPAQYAAFMKRVDEERKKLEAPAPAPKKEDSLDDIFA